MNNWLIHNNCWPHSMTCITAVRRCLGTKCIDMSQAKRNASSKKWISMSLLGCYSTLERRNGESWKEILIGTASWSKLDNFSFCRQIREIIKYCLTKTGCKPKCTQIIQKCTKGQEPQSKTKGITLSSKATLQALKNPTILPFPRQSNRQTALISKAFCKFCPQKFHANPIALPWHYEQRDDALLIVNVMVHGPTGETGVQASTKYCKTLWTSSFFYHLYPFQGEFLMHVQLHPKDIPTIS